MSEYEYHEGDRIGDMKLEGKPFLECDFIDVDPWRVYYVVKEHFQERRMGYEAVAVTFGSSPAHVEMWSGDTSVSDIIQVCAYWDGPRHIWFNQDQEGYIYYPAYLIDLFAAINKLSDKFCNSREERL